jgi:hypothetical protein
MTIGSQNKQPESYVTYHQNGQAASFVGPDAVALFRAAAIRSGLLLYAKTGLKPNRMWTPTAMLQAATAITGQKYRRGQHAKAAEDIKVWCDAMKAALPVVEG